MANGQYIGVNGVARKVTTPYIGVEGVARKVTNGYVGVDGVARLFFAPEGGKAVLEVEKITSDTYANETTYTGEEFILLDIYPKTGGTVNVTYGGLTKTIMDTSGAEEPNAQEVFFGTFNGVSDSVETPASGMLTIDGEFHAFSIGGYGKSAKGLAYCTCVVDIIDFGNLDSIPSMAFTSCKKLTNVEIPKSVTSIGVAAFNGCEGLTNVLIPSSVTTIFSNPFGAINKANFVTVDGGNTVYKIEGNCLIEISTKTIISGFLDSVIPSSVTSIGGSSFYGLKGLKNITIPSSVTSIGGSAFSDCSELENIILLATTPPSIDTVYDPFSGTTCTFTVLKGFGDSYKAEDMWSKYADRIVEAS